MLTCAPPAKSTLGENGDRQEEEELPGGAPGMAAKRLPFGWYPWLQLEPWPATCRAGRRAPAGALAAGQLGLGSRPNPDAGPKISSPKRS